MSQLSDSLWMELKKQACVHPETAVMIVTLSKRDFEKAFEQWIYNEEDKVFDSLNKLQNAPKQ